MTEVFLCERGQLTVASKRDLRAAGVVVAEVADITKAAFVRSSEIVSADDMLWAALDALNSDKSGYSGAREQREVLARNLLTIVNAQRKASA